MLVGYARISTTDQTLSLQQDALGRAGCERIFTDTASGAKADRPGLEEAVEYVRSGDTLIVWKLDRLGRSLPHLIETVKQLEQRGIGFRSLTEQIDTTTSGGTLIFHVFGALAEFERNLIRERTMAGLASARARGRNGGHPRAAGLNDAKKVALAQRLYEDKTNTIVDICQTLRVSRATLYRYLNTSKQQHAEKGGGESNDTTHVSRGHRR
jgi:DNA invertase Pin-like site-specific DNA recombinase